MYLISNGIVERCIGIFRQELLNHIIPFNEKHLYYLLSEFISNYYNVERTHQGISCETPVKFEVPFETIAKETVLKSKSFLNGLYHLYQKAA